MLAVVDRTVEERLDVAADGGERCLQLVAHVGHEILTNALEAPHLRDVLEDDDHAHRVLIVEAVRLGANDRVLVRDAHLELGLGGAIGLPRGRQQDVEPRDVAQGGQRLVRGVPVDPEQLPRGVIGESHAVVLVHRDDALDHPGDHRAEALLLGGEVRDAL